MSTVQAIRPKVVIVPVENPAAKASFLRWLLEAAREADAKKQGKEAA